MGFWSVGTVASAALAASRSPCPSMATQIQAVRSTFSEVRCRNCRRGFLLVAAILPVLAGMSTLIIR